MMTKPENPPIRTLDLLWRQVQASCEACYPVLGVPLRFAANAPVLSEIAAGVFGPACCGDGEAPRLEFRCFVQDIADADAAAPAPLCRAQGEYFFLTAGQTLGFADRAAGFAVAFVPPALLADRAFLEVGLIECLGLCLASRFRPATLHAAAVVDRDGRCVLLAGGEGAGKSTLAHACLRAGFRLLSEDVVFAELREDQVYAWGSPRFLHLRPDAVRFFPELSGLSPVRQLNGETKLRLRVEATCPGSRIDAVLSLGRVPGAVSRLHAADPRAVRQALTGFKGDPMLERAAMEAAVDRLLSTGRCAHLRVGNDPAEAACLVSEWLQRG